MILEFLYLMITTMIVKNYINELYKYFKTHS